MRVTSEDIRNRKWTEAEKEAIRRAAADRAAGLDLPEEEYEDIPRLTAEQLAQMVRLRGSRRKQAVSVRLDPEVLAWLRSKGEGHLTRINDILTNLMEAERKSRRTASSRELQLLPLVCEQSLWSQNRDPGTQFRHEFACWEMGHPPIDGNIPP